jgi:hypothetical protein|tara:strand:- start:82 stop:399 length:318 start_codon:yes stop_codon:yes gene_type:complete
MFDIRGKIIKTETVNINTPKGDFVKKLITIEKVGSTFKDVNQFEIFGEENIKVIENSQRVKEGERVNIKFYIKSNEFKGKFYNTLMIKELLVENSLVEESNEAPF